MILVLQADGQLMNPEMSNTLPHINPQLHSSSSFQVLFDLGRVFAVEALSLLVEFGIALIDVVNVSIVIVGTPAAVFSTLLNPVWEGGRVGRGKRSKTIGI